jgi:hypothetical protein
MSRIESRLRKFSLAAITLVLAAALCAQVVPASAQFRMGFARFGYARPTGGFARGHVPGRGYGGRYGWNDNGRRYRIYPQYPVYPVYPGYPVEPYDPPGVSRPHHHVAQSTTPLAGRHVHRAANHGHLPAAVADNRTYAPHELITEFAHAASPEAIDQLARRYHLTRIDSRDFTLIGSRLYRWRIRDDRAVEDIVSALHREEIIASVQPNYLYTLQEQSIRPIVTQGDPAQYVLGKLQVVAAHDRATGKHVLVAVIDSDIDTKHPDLIGTVVKSFDALHGTARPHEHGTAMAGAIAAHGKLLGIAPDAELLAARAFGGASGPAQGTSFAIYESLQWAADNRARIVNMSFAGPEDPMLHKMLAASYGRNMILIAAAGNDGPQAAPLYPAADPDVIAVTATDDNDGLYKIANRGSYVAIAAPGVEVLAIAPGRAYEITTGTSVAAAHVSGIAALLLERHASLTPADVRRILMGTAKPLGTAEQSDEFGAGLANAYRATLAGDTPPNPAGVEAKQ